MSSIVKGNMIFDSTKNFELDKAKKETYLQNEKDGVDYIDEQQQQIIIQAIKKSKYIDGEANKRADSILQDTYKTSRKIMIEAEEKGHKEGYKTGYAEGLVNGANEAIARAEKGLNEINQLINTLKEEQAALIENQKDELIEFAFQLAQKVVKQQLQVDENAIPKMLEQIIGKNMKNVKIYLSEYNKALDFQIKESIYEKIHEKFENVNIVLVKDEDTIMVETEGGMTDLNIAGQFGRLRKAVDSI